MPVYYGVDLNDSDYESPGDNDYDTWEDWCDSDIRDRYCRFLPDDEESQLKFSYNSLAEEGTSNIEPKAFLVDLLAVASGPSMYRLMEEEPGLDSVHTAHDLKDLDHITTSSPMHQ